MLPTVSYQSANLMIVEVMLISEKVDAGYLMQRIRSGRKVNRLYQLYAQAELPGREWANLAASKAPTFRAYLNQWSRIAEMRRSSNWTHC